MYDELTAVDIQKMQAEIDYRKLELRPKLGAALQEARAQGDLSENFEYKAAKQEVGRNNSRIRYLEQMIKTAKIVEDHSTTDTVGLFDHVTIFMEHRKDLCFGHNLATKSCKRVHQQRISAGRSSDG